ncbi:hypothetical protein [Streptomyces rugosispiralis]|uniref:Uncharacterized protein n=1 Tax=Streptomyces rugosispiralis TaxID=2967341 RepID=A0ABT1UP60_9ACTN|nr:hypothetical protein [Streptomyces rugosispiralis]MCQ8186756.1 hypothetical protein [Streptomyces rugosispiralis]
MAVDLPGRGTRAEVGLDTVALADRLVDDAAALLTEAVDLSGYRREIPRTYVHLTRDQCYVEELQRRSLALLRPEVIDLDAGHMAMISAPESSPPSSTLLTADRGKACPADSRSVM